MNMNKLFSTLTVKSFNEDEGVFTGIASTPSTDRVGDIVDSAGITAKHMPVPLLWQHQHDKPAGIVESMTPTAKGLEVVCRVLKDASAEVKSYWEFVKAGAVSLSIGFKPVEYAPLAAGGYHYKQVELLELSLVTVPAHQDARILTTKQHQEAPKKPVIHIEGTSTMTIAEQIASFEAKKSVALAGMDTLVQKGVTLQGDDEAAYARHEAEVAEIEKHLARLKDAEARQAKSARPVQGVNITVADNAPKGTAFTRYAKALALGRGNPMQALEIAKGMGYGNQVETVLKAAVAAGSTTSADFSVLVEPQLMAAEFIDLLKAQQIVSRLQLRNVPMNIRLPKATSGTSANWIGEGKAAPLTNAAFGDMEIGEHKVGGIVAFTEELLRRSEPAAEALVRDDLLQAVAQAVDVAFISSTNAGIAGVKPASIANGATSAAASGVSAEAVRADVKAAYAAAIAANQPIASACWIMHPSLALNLSMMVVPFTFTTNVDSVTQDVTTITSGQREFPGIDFVNGGYFEGLPVVLSTNVPGDAVNGYDLLLVVQNEILLAEGGLAIDASREASLEFDSAPTHDSKTPTPAQLVSLWQTGSIALKAIRGVTWARRRPSAVYRISAAKYN